ncbi:MAG: glycosyltransferase family 4 protein, partial [Nitrososphaerales archaeon]
MNITIVCPFYYPNLIGGAEVSIKLLAEWLASNDFNVQVVSFDGRIDSETINKVKVKRYPVISTKGLSLTLMYPVLRAMQKFEGITDLYHVYDAYPAIGAGLYKTFKGKRRIVATLDNYAGFCPVSTAICSACDRFPSRMRCLFEQTSTLEKPLGFTYALIYPLLSRLARKLDKYIAVSNIVAELYVKYGFNSQKIVVIPNFIDIKSMKLDRTKSGNKKFNILYVGAVSRHKGIDLLIQAFKIIESARPYLHLTLVGKGKWLSYCKSLVKKLQIEDKV